MIQRIQSLYLLAVLIIGLLVFFFNPTYASFKNENGTQVKVGYTKTTSMLQGKGTEMSKYLNYIIILTISLGSGAAIFLYKKTALQKKICIYLTLISALLIVVMFMEYTEQLRQNKDGSIGIWAVFPVLFMACTALAWNHIRMDENLIKNMDRIR